MFFLTKRFFIHFSISVEKNSTFILLQSEHEEVKLHPFSVFAVNCF